MAVFAHSTLIDNGPAILATRAATANRIRQVVIAGYTAGDSYSTVSANTRISAPMLPGDFTITAGGSNSRVLTIAAKNTVAATGSTTGSDLHCAIIDTTTSEVLLVSDEQSNTNIVSGSNYNLASWSMTFAQPTQV